MEEALRASPELRGKTTLDASIGATGRVLSVSLTSSDFTDRKLRTCLLEATRGLTFSPAPARRVGVRITVHLAPGDAPVLRVEDADVDDRDGTGTMVLREVDAALREASEELSECFERGLANDFGLWGRLQLRIELAGEEGPARASEDQSRFPDSAAAACAISAIEATDLPKAIGAPVILGVGIRFGELNRATHEVP